MVQPAVRPKPKTWLQVFLFLFLVGVGFMLTLYGASLRQVPLPDPEEPQLVIGGTDFGPGKAWLHQGDILLPLEVVREQLDPNIFWDEGEDTAIITTADRVVRMKTANLTAFVNDQPTSLRVPLSRWDERTYIPLEFLEEVYRIEITHNRETGTVVVDSWDKPLRRAVVQGNNGVYLRHQPSHFAPRVTYLSPGDQVFTFAAGDNWFRVRTAAGLVGYLPQNRVGEIQLVERDAPPPASPQPWRPQEGPVSLVWEYVGNSNPDPASIGPMPGVNVVSPTWFYLLDEEGNLANKASTGYVNWARKRGYQVWGLVTNSFDPDLTTAMLNSSANRQHFIRQLLTYAVLYELDGINLDFENMYLRDREVYVQLVRELAPLMREQGLTLSVDVTFISSSENWSMVYDRAALAELVDYVAVMAYDEHWGTSPQAGSVSSLPWAKRGLERILEEVPPEKLLLGIPFYTRLWLEVEQPDGTLQVSSQALSMKGAEDFLAQAGVEPVFDPRTGQNYGEVQQGDSRYRVWLEDETSLGQRLELVHRYDLAGIAAWRRGFEKPEIWPLIAAELDR